MYRALFLALVLLLIAAPPGHAAASHGATSRHSCLISSATYLAVRDLGPFTRFLDTTYPASPFGGHTLPGTQPPLVTQFRVARMQGFIANVALHGRYRRENDARARSLGYTVGKWPLVPLVGKVVRDNPGILEIYETHWVWRSLTGARAHMRSIRGSLALDPNVHRFPVHLGDAAYGDVSRLGPHDGLHEKVVAVDVRLDDAVLTLSIQGGNGIARTRAVSLARTVIGRIATACETQT